MPGTRVPVRGVLHVCVSCREGCEKVCVPRFPPFGKGVYPDLCFARAKKGKLIFNSTTYMPKIEFIAERVRLCCLF